MLVTKQDKHMKHKQLYHKIIDVAARLLNNLPNYACGAQYCCTVLPILNVKGALVFTTE